MNSENSKPASLSGAISCLSHAAKSSPKQHGLMKCGLTSRCSKSSVATLIVSSMDRAQPLLLENELALLVAPAHAREKGHAEEVHAEGVVGNDQRQQVAHDDVADVDHAQLDARRAALA